jgi:hypothetical protein
MTTAVRPQRTLIESRGSNHSGPKLAVAELVRHAERRRLLNPGKTSQDLLD